MTRVYDDVQQQREILTLTDAESTGAEMEVSDPATGERVGGIALTVDAAGDYVEGAWSITDADGQLVGKVLARKTGRAVGGASPGAGSPHAMDITVGGAIVGVLRRKSNVIGYELSVDFFMDVANLLDRRLGLAAAIFAALEHGRTD